MRLFLAKILYCPVAQLCSALLGWTVLLATSTSIASSARITQSEEADDAEGPSNTVQPKKALLRLPPHTKQGQHLAVAQYQMAPDAAYFCCADCLPACHTQSRYQAAYPGIIHIKSRSDLLLAVPMLLLFIFRFIDIYFNYRMLLILIIYLFQKRQLTRCSALAPVDTVCFRPA